MPKLRSIILYFVAVAGLSIVAIFSSAEVLSMQTNKAFGENDIPEGYSINLLNQKYTKRVEMIPMRDGVKLQTVILVPNDAHNIPIMFTRTPSYYNNRVNYQLV